MQSWRLGSAPKRDKGGAFGASSTGAGSGASSSSSVNNGQFNGNASKSAGGSASQPGGKNGMLLIRVVDARGITLPIGVHPLPAPKGFAMPSQAVLGAGLSGSGNANTQARKPLYWLPYLILEFDKNEIIIDAIGGDVINTVWQYRAHFDVSKSSEVSISCYLRSSPPSIPPSGASGANQLRKGGDHFLGGVKLRPQFTDKLQDEWHPLVGGLGGSIHVQICFRRDHQNLPMTIDNFDLLKVVGKGSFGKVMQVRKRDTNRIYAMKILRKSHIVSRSEVDHTMAERTVLAQIDNPFIVGLKFSFQSPQKLYLVLAFVNGGELFRHLQLEGRFSEVRSRFYTAELLCALECLHKFNVIYRDLKPENILLDYNGHINLCDFGLCKLNMSESDTTNTFCGTPEYLAPELLLGQGYTKTVDWWTLGVLLYEMLTGLPPFYDENTNEMYRKILQDEIRFPEDVTPQARSILTGVSIAYR